MKIIDPAICQRMETGYLEGHTCTMAGLSNAASCLNFTALTGILKTFHRLSKTLATPLSIYLMFYFWPLTLFTCTKSSDTCELQFRRRSSKGRLKPSRDLWIFVSTIVWWRDKLAWPLTARHGGANEMEPERMWLVTELLGFDDQLGAQGPVMWRSTQSCLADGQRLSSELMAEKLQWGSCPGSWPLRRLRAPR